MNKSLVVAACAVLVVQPACLSAKEPIELAPSSTWSLSYDEEACRLSRSFGEGEGQVLLTLSRFAPGTSIEVLAAGHPLKSNGATRLGYALDPQDERVVDRPVFGETQNGATIWQFSTDLIPEKAAEKLRKEGAVRADFRKVEADLAGEITSFSVTRGVRQPVRLRTGRLSAAMSAMDMCLDDLVESWGFDLAEQGTIAQGPTPASSPEKWINHRDYPSDALRKDMAGMVRFRLAVSPEGRVTGCTIQSDHSHPDFPKAVCDAFTRDGRFDPAVTVTGKPVASYWSNTVLFVPR